MHVLIIISFRIVCKAQVYRVDVGLLNQIRKVFSG